MTQPAPAGTSAAEVTAVWAEAKVTDLLAHTAADFVAPAYGTTLWARLAAGDPVKSAAVITAAELWRRQEAEQARLEELYHHDPETWFREITAEADTAAARLGRTLASTPTWEECRKRRQHRPPWPSVATPDWGPVAISGRPGWWRHCINGEQVDLPRRDIETLERRDAA
jgi:hypothetical protein